MSRWSEGRFAPLALAAAAAILLGYVIAMPRGLVLIALIAALGAVVALWAFNRGVALAGVVVGILNGIPGLDLASFTTPSSFRADDALVILLLGMLVIWCLQRGVRRSRAVRLALIWSAAFAGWWAVTFVRSTAFDTIPPLEAALYGRDFLYFALLFPAFAALVWKPRELAGLAYTLAAAAVVFALAATLSTAGGIDLDFITHPTSTGVTEGLQRIYSPMNDLVVLSLALGFGLAMVGDTRRMKRIGMALTLVMGVALAAQLTRALYVSTIIAFVLTTALWLHQRDALALQLRRTSFAVIVTVGLVASTIAFLGPHAFGGGAAGAIVNRATSGITEVKSSSGDFGYRVELADTMVRIIGVEWPVGLGFLHPSSHYEPDLPDGSIRNSDLGVSNVIMTMGMVGAILLYLPIVAMLVAVYRNRQRIDSRFRWVGFGIMACLLLDLLDSPTLATLFNVPGLVLVALMLAIASRTAVAEDALRVRARQPQPHPQPQPPAGVAAAATTWTR